MDNILDMLHLWLDPQVGYIVGSDDDFCLVRGTSEDQVNLVEVVGVSDLGLLLLAEAYPDITLCS